MILLEVRRIVEAAPFVAACFLSLSGEGIKAIARIPASFETHLRSWLAVEQYFAERGLTIDPATKDVCRLCFVSSDPEAFSRLDVVEIVPVELPESAERSFQQASNGTIRPAWAREVLAKVAAKVGRPDREDWLRIASATFQGVGVEAGIELLHDYFPEEERGEYRELARTLETHIPWNTLRTFGVNPDDPADAIADLPDLSDEPATETSSGFPQVITGAELLDKYPHPPPDVIRGVIGEGEKLMLAGSSKVGKTFALLSLAASISNGGEWLGFQCSQGEVLFINFEIPGARMGQRIKRIEGAGQVYFLNLRGTKTSWVRLKRELKKIGMKFKLIVLDPIYKMLHGKNENDNGEIADLLLEIEQLAAGMGAAVAFAHHFSKGSKANVSQIDRASGAGTWARDPDAIITLTDHEAERCFTVEATLRNYAAPVPSVWRFDYPNFTRVQGGDPQALRGSARKDKKGSAQDVLKILADGPLPKRAILERLVAQLGCSEKTAERRLKEADPHLSNSANGIYSLATDI